jgi:hypothetical protein
MCGDDTGFKKAYEQFDETENKGESEDPANEQRGNLGCYDTDAWYKTKLVLYITE